MNETEHAVRELVKATRALAEGDFDRETRQDFQGELGKLAAQIETLRHNLKTLSPKVTSSVHLMPEAAKGVAEISQQAEMTVNSILGLVDEMCVDQERISAMLERVAQGETEALDLCVLQAITDRSRTSLISLMSYLSFQDVLRQRAEKVQAMIDTVEEKIRELLAKFKLKVNEPGTGGEPSPPDPGRCGSSESPAVDQNFVDDFFK